jgi:hypothetical protein|eukprot:7379218-Prymnesium_polylepis.2
MCRRLPTDGQSTSSPNAMQLHAVAEGFVETAAAKHGCTTMPGDLMGNWANRSAGVVHAASGDVAFVDGGSLLFRLSSNGNTASPAADGDVQLYVACFAYAKRSVADSEVPAPSNARWNAGAPSFEYEVKYVGRDNVTSGKWSDLSKTQTLRCSVESARPCSVS